MSVDTCRHLRAGMCLANPSRMQSGEVDEARGSKPTCVGLDGAESERLASREVGQAWTHDGTCVPACGSRIRKPDLTLIDQPGASTRRS